MPAMLDDPTAPTIYRTSGEAPYPNPQNPVLAAGIAPRSVTLRDKLTIATIVPFASRQQVPPSLWTYLSEILNKEIEMGDTYPMTEGMPAEKFASYWFQNFGAVMLLGHYEKPEDVHDDQDWSVTCLGSFYIKPNYPGRSSHVCNAGFLVTPPARNRGVGRLMGEAYLEWAPKLGYTYSVFNLVYETNVASCRIWDALGFKRIGRVPGCGNLKSYPDRYIDAIIYGRDLVSEPLQEVTTERFDKIKSYLKTGEYPPGSDRAEKSRLRSAATHYKLIPGPDPDDARGDKLMLKDKEVISDPAVQYRVAKEIHNAGHGGINKTTSTIAERYHWVGIKHTASLVTRDCKECKDGPKVPPIHRNDGLHKRILATSSQPQEPSPPDHFEDPLYDSPVNHIIHPNPPPHLPPQIYHHSATLSAIRSPHHPHNQQLHSQSYIDPQIMSDPQSHLSTPGFTHSETHSSHHHHPSDSPFSQHATDADTHSTQEQAEHADEGWREMIASHEQHSAENRAPSNAPHDGDLDMLLEDHEDDDAIEDDSRGADRQLDEDVEVAKSRAQQAAKAAVASLRDHDDGKDKSKDDVDMYDGSSD